MRKLPKISTWDFSRMYTNIPQSDIIAMHRYDCNEIIAMYHAMNTAHKGSCLTRILITLDADTNEFVAEFTDDPIISTRTKLVITLDDYHDRFFKFVIQHTIVEHEGVIYQQTDGIGMGVVPAVYFANNYCNAEEGRF